MLIAGHALSIDVTLVTGNTREFERVEGLKIENWIAARPTRKTPRS
jgi:tRNA(fMet)-specific endonuclease VapC